MLQQDKPEDYVISTGRMESVRTFIELSAKALNWNKGKSDKGDYLGRRELMSLEDVLILEKL